MFFTVKKIHFIGIGGIGMSGLAEILINRGFSVSGSDIAESENTQYLRKIGARVLIGHSPNNISDAEVVVYSSAVDPDTNSEVLQAHTLGIPILRRAEMLAQVSRLNYCLAIAGTHGKTTTTSMLGLLLIEAGYDPTVIVGGRLKDFGGTNARLGNGNWSVLEADEYDRSFLQLLPTVAIINNIEPEHLDIYRDFDDIKETYKEFANKVPFYGFVAFCVDDGASSEISEFINKKKISFGLSKNADFSAQNISFQGNLTNFNVYEFGKFVDNITIRAPGVHNVRNSLAVISVGRTLGISFEIIKKALSQFSGILRRFDIKGIKNDIMIVDDYAHHPTEVRATLKAAKDGWNKRIVCVFQPHTYTRTRDFYKEFAESFVDADISIITDIYPAREQPIDGVNVELILNSMKNSQNIIYEPDFEKIPDLLLKLLIPGDMLITIGAGSVYRIADKVMDLLELS